jgi:hypothetical protein
MEIATESSIFSSKCGASAVRPRKNSNCLNSCIRFSVASIVSKTGVTILEAQINLDLRSIRMITQRRHCANLVVLICTSYRPCFSPTHRRVLMNWSSRLPRFAKGRSHLLSRLVNVTRLWRRRKVGRMVQAIDDMCRSGRHAQNEHRKGQAKAASALPNGASFLFYRTLTV